MKKGPVDPWFFELGKRPDTREVADQKEPEVNSPFTQPKPHDEVPKEFTWSDIGKWVREHPMYGKPGDNGQWAGKEIAGS
jgi:hypothetical protein